jgi:CheY-specific phosphatase CheX
MDVKYVNVFSEVLSNTFETAFSERPFRCGDFQRVSGDIKNPDDLMCILNFSGELFGTLITTFPESGAKKIYAALMMEEPPELGQDAVEAFTEIQNMIAGNVRAALNDAKIQFDPPIVALGKSRFENPDRIPWLLVPMAFKEWGRFNLLIGIKATN